MKAVGRALEAWTSLGGRLAETMFKEPGEYEFACQMGMFRGKLIVE